MTVFFTHVTYNFLPQAITLMESINKQFKECKTLIVPLDEESHSILTKMKLDSYPLNENDFSQIKSSYQNLLSNRNKAESVFTLKPLLCNLILSRLDDKEILCYADADSFFFDSKSFYNTIKSGSSIYLSPHFESSKLVGSIAKDGKFNAGLIAFRNDHIGREASELWMNLCLEWCYQKHQNEKYADQKYLEQINSTYKLFVGYFPRELNVANWRFERKNYLKGYKFSTYETEHFHFHSLKFNYQLHIFNITRYTKIRNIRNMRNDIYKPYVRQVQKNIFFLKAHYGYVYCISGKITFGELIKSFFKRDLYLYIFRNDNVI